MRRNSSERGRRPSQAEMESLLYENDHAMLLPDTKWDGKDESAMYTLAILRDVTLRSVRITAHGPDDAR